MKIIKDITRGGQIGYHLLNMFAQVNQKFKWPAIIMTLFVAGYFIKDMPKIYYYDAANYYQAYVLDQLPKVNKDSELKMTYVKVYGKSEIKSVKSVINSWTVKHNKKKFWEYLKVTMYFCIGGITSLYILIMIFFKYIGVTHRASKINRGASFEEVSSLANKILQEGNASWLKVGSLPLIKDKETSHIIVTGTTGSGKSNCIKSLLLQIKEKGQKAIIIDTTGEYVNSFYDSKKDIILNPYDDRGKTWDIWKECSTEFELDNFVNALFPKNLSSEEFWSTAPKLLFKSVFERTAESEDRTYKRIYHCLVNSSMKELTEYLKDTAAENLMDSRNDKTAMSVRSTTIPYVQFLTRLSDVQEDNSFTIRDWVKNDDINFLFISCSAEQRVTMRPLFSAWMDIAISSLMSSGIDPSRRLWFIIDELTSLQKLPNLKTILAESRKFGGCCLIGTQSTPDIYETYGQNLAMSMLNNFNTRLFFRCIDPTTQQWIVKSLGSYEEEVPVENYSYGAHQMRDGVSITTHTRVKDVIFASELSQLKDLEAFVQLPEGLPITKIKMNFTYTEK